MKSRLLLYFIVLISLSLTACSAIRQADVQGSTEQSQNENVTTSSNPVSETQSKNDVGPIYPAYVSKQGERVWGYIDKTGKFIIEPQYEWAYDFQENGLSCVSKNSRMGLVNEEGREIVKPVYDFITDYSEGIAVAEKDNVSYAIDEEGKILFESKDSVGQFQEGLSRILRTNDGIKTAYGYVDKEGKVVVEPRYEYASPFKNNKALVKVKDNHYALIDKSGKSLAEYNYRMVRDLSEDLLVYTGDNDMAGYLKADGSRLTDAKFSYAEPFENGFAVVGIPSGSNDIKYGAIDKNGAYIIKPEYTSLKQVGEDMFAASTGMVFPPDDTFVKKAIINSEGKRITDFLYYDIGGFSNGSSSVSEDVKTYFISKSGDEVQNLPNFDSPGTMKIRGDLIKADIDNEIVYIDKGSRVIWKPDNTMKLSSGVEIWTIKYRPDRCMLIYYPEISNLPDKNIESSINQELKKEFVGDGPVSSKENGQYTEIINAGFNVSDIKNLLVFEKDGYFYSIGAAHPQSYAIYYHVDVKTGKFYNLADLFKKGSSYLKELSAIVNGQIKEKSKDPDSMFYPDTAVDMQNDQQFAIAQNSLKIIYQPYEIAPYAAGLPEFEIPFTQVMDIIDTSGDFWKSFN